MSFPQVLVFHFSCPHNLIIEFSGGGYNDRGGGGGYNDRGGGGEIFRRVRGSVTIRVELMLRPPFAHTSQQAATVVEVAAMVEGAAGVTVSL